MQGQRRNDWAGLALESRGFHSFEAGPLTLRASSPAFDARRPPANSSLEPL